MDNVTAQATFPFWFDDWEGDKCLALRPDSTFDLRLKTYVCSGDAQKMVACLAWASAGNWCVPDFSDYR